MTSNITLLTGVTPKSVTCENARFMFRPISDDPTYIWERPLDIEDEEAIIKNWNTQHMKFWEATDTEIQKQKEQLNHIQDQSIKDAIELKKVKNKEKISDLIAEKNSSIQGWWHFTGIIVSMMFLVYLLVRLLMFCRAGIIKCKHSCNSCCCLPGAGQKRTKGERHTRNDQSENQLFSRGASTKSRKSQARSQTRSIYEVAST